MIIGFVYIETRMHGYQSKYNTSQTDNTSCLLFLILLSPGGFFKSSFHYRRNKFLVPPTTYYFQTFRELKNEPNFVLTVSIFITTLCITTLGCWYLDTAVERALNHEVVLAVLTERQISDCDVKCRITFSFKWKFHVYGPQ